MADGRAERRQKHRARQVRNSQPAATNNDDEEEDGME
jgi:hypothetical protein